MKHTFSLFDSLHALNKCNLIEEQVLQSMWPMQCGDNFSLSKLQNKKRKKKRRKYPNRLETIKMVVWSSIVRAVARPNPFSLLSKPNVSPAISKNGKSISFSCSHKISPHLMRNRLQLHGSLCRCYAIVCS